MATLQDAFAHECMPSVGIVQLRWGLLLWAGMMPIMTYGGFKRMTTFCKTKVPKEVSDALEAVKAGDLYATVAQYPYAVGQLGVQACEKAMAGDDVPEEITSPTALVTKDKAAEAISKFPAPFEAFENPLD